MSEEEREIKDRYSALYDHFLSSPSNERDSEKIRLYSYLDELSEVHRVELLRSVMDGCFVAEYITHAVKNNLMSIDVVDLIINGTMKVPITVTSLLVEGLASYDELLKSLRISDLHLVALNYLFRNGRINHLLRYYSTPLTRLSFGVHLYCAAMISVEKTNELVKAASRVMSCGDMFSRVYHAPNRYLTGSVLLAEDAVINHCGLSFDSYDISTRYTTARYRLRYLLDNRDQV